MTMKTKNHFILFLLILVIGSALRIYDLSGEDIWLDEGISLRIARLDSVGAVMTPSNLDDNPPLYYLLLHYWIRLTDDSEWSLRFLSVLFSTLSIFLLYTFGKILFNEKIALLSSVMLALSNYQVQYAQEARCYALLSCLAIGAMLAYYLFLQGATNRGGAALVLMNTLLLYTHPYGLFIVLSQNLHFFTHHRISKHSPKPSTKSWFALQTVVLVLFIPWLGVILKRFIDIQQTGLPIGEPSFWDLPGAFKTYCADHVLLGMFFMVLAGAAFLSRPNPHEQLITPHRFWGFFFDPTHNQQVYFLALWVCVPLLVPFVISKASTPIYQTRYLIAVSPAFYLLVSKGAFQFSKKIIPLLVLVLVLIFFSAATLAGYRTQDKESWRTMVACVEKNAQANDTVLLYPSYPAMKLVYAYYASRDDVEIITLPHYQRLSLPERQQAVQALIVQHPRFWMIINPELPNAQQLIQALEKSYEATINKRYKDFYVFLWLKKTTTAVGADDRYEGSTIKESAQGM